MSEDAEKNDFLIDMEAYRVAREARSLEINLFWQRSNYFLVLSTATAAGFFSLKEKRFLIPLAIFGAVVAFLWIQVNLGSKFWQSRWEHRVKVAEEQLRQGMDLFSADWETARQDVLESFKFKEHSKAYGVYLKLVLIKPSVSLTMTLLSVAFLCLWVALAIIAISTR